MVWQDGARPGLIWPSFRRLLRPELRHRLSENTINALDVRREGEWTAGHVAGAAWWPLDRFRIAPPEVDLDIPLAVHCQSGYRSMIACSLLQRAGFKNVMNVSGGFAAWQEAQLPVEKGSAVRLDVFSACIAPLRPRAFNREGREEYQVREKSPRKKVLKSRSFRRT